MDSTLALGALRIARGAGGEAVREREPRRAGEASPKPPPKPPPNPRSGLCPELLADFRIPKPPGCSQGAQRAVSCAVRVADFLAEGRGGEPPQGVAASWGARRRRLSRRWSLNLNSSIRLRSRLYGFHTGTRSLSNRKGRGRRSGGREREPRRAGEGRCLESKLLRPDRLWPVGSKK